MRLASDYFSRWCSLHPWLDKLLDRLGQYQHPKRPGQHNRGHRFSDDHSGAHNTVACHILTDSDGEHRVAGSTFPSSPRSVIGASDLEQDTIQLFRSSPRRYRRPREPVAALTHARRRTRVLILLGRAWTCLAALPQWCFGRRVGDGGRQSLLRALAKLLRQRETCGYLRPLAGPGSLLPARGGGPNGNTSGITRTPVVNLNGALPPLG